MKTIIAIVALVIATPALADTYVRGYTRSNGTYVAPHYRSSPDSSRSNNWSSQGNVNPYTGRSGTVAPSQPSNPYGLYGTKRNTYGIYGR